MATLKAVVDHRKADGTYNVKIRLTHNRKALYIPTELYITERQMTRSKRIKDPNIVSATDNLIDEMRKAISSIPRIENMECSQLREVLRRKMSEGEVFRLDFFEYAAKKIVKMKESNRYLHQAALDYLADMSGGRLDVNDITYALMSRYRAYLEDKGYSVNSIIAYLAKIRHIVNIAKDEYNDDDVMRVRVNPFRKGIVPQKELTEHRVMSAEQIRRISEIKGDRYENFARDMFILSFYLIGVNLVDLRNVKKTALKDGILTYNRTKTKDNRQDKALISVKVEREAMEIIDRYRDYCSDYLLDLHRRYNDMKSLNSAVNKYLRRLHRYDKRIPSNFTYYYARHTWATIAYNDCGIDMQTIHEALNHASDANMKITDVYVKKDFTRIWDANRKVLDFVFEK